MNLSEFLSHYDGPLARLIRDFWLGTPPDPWPEAIDAIVRSPEAVPLCVYCLCPQAHHSWFCPHCGKPTGDQVAWMPYLQVFVMGELFRNGVMGPPERRRGVQLFLVVYSAAQYGVFAPLYWFWMLRKAQGKPNCHEVRMDLPFAEETHL
jgi:hypothetical protein